MTLGPIGTSPVTVTTSYRGKTMKNGDKVKILRTDVCSNSEMGRYVGMVGELHAADTAAGHSGPGWRVKCGDGRIWFWLTSSLELVDAATDATPQFKLRDKVYARCLDENSISAMKKYVGVVGEIYLIDCFGVRVRYSDGITWGFKFSSLEYAEKKQPRPADRLVFTCAATIVLASGREVRIPDPDPEHWELVETQKDCPVGPVTASVEEAGSFIFPSFGCGGSRVEHDEGRCWLKDMFRAVNETNKVDDFTTRYAYVTELRTYREKAPESKQEYQCSQPTLRTLW
jgi:hypothetical protein